MSFVSRSLRVQRGQWRDWGGPTATARATMNDADLNNHNSVATAPRVRSAVTIVASHTELCKGRRVYSSVVIHFNGPHKGPSTEPDDQYLPAGCSKTT